MSDQQQKTAIPHSAFRIPQSEAAWVGEMGEAAAAADLQLALPADLAADLGAQLHTVGGAVVLIVARVPQILLNRVIGLGVAEPAGEALVDQVVDLYRAAGVPPAVQLSPGAQPPELGAWLAARGLHPDDHWIKLVRGVEPPLEPVTDLRVERIGPAQAPAFAATFGVVFGLPDPLRVWIECSVGRPGWQHYLAFDGDQPVATGALFVYEQIGWLGVAATLRSHRRRGAQSALIARRIRDAAALGCRRLTVETGDDTSAQPGPSLRNLLHMGFEVAYLRPNYVGTMDDGRRTTDDGR